MTALTASQTLTTFSYRIGAPSITSQQYAFEEDVPCNYAKTVTIENLPAFMVHNEATSDFTISANTDLNLIGSYEVIVKGEIEVLADPGTVVLSDSFTFAVLIEPCIVDSFHATQAFTEIVYNIGGPGLTGGSYEFGQSPACDYAQAIEVIQLPAFATHNTLTSDFTVPQNDDLSLIGGYEVVIRATISVPTDHTKSAFTAMTSEIAFTLKIEACLLDSFSGSLASS